MSFPALICVPAGGCSSLHSRSFKRHLRDAGFTSILVPDLPCLNCEPPIKTILDDVAVTRECIQGALSRDEDVVLVLHSASAIIGSAAMKGYLKEECEEEGRG